MLNMNAVKFKLTKMRSMHIRYEVIYKNLLRDLRKYYTQEFNDHSDYAKRKKCDEFSYLRLLREFVMSRFPAETLSRLAISFEELVFCLGSLIYPKQMLGMLETRDTHEQIRVFIIQDYLYKFSLERLQNLLSSPPMVLLFMNYLKKTQFSRISQNTNMCKFRDAYIEACFIMMQLNPSSDIMNQEFPINDIMKHSGWSQQFQADRLLQLTS